MMKNFLNLKVWEEDRNNLILLCAGMDRQNVFMNLELIREYCLKKKGVTEELPFDENSPVYKVMGKIFLIASVDTPVSINIKCDPEEAVEMRERYDAVVPGYHMNKRHWNTVYLDGTLPSKVILEWIEKSYNLVVACLKKADKVKLALLDI